METNSLKPQEFYSRNLCIKHRAAPKRSNLLTSFDEKIKETKWDRLTFLLQKTNWNTSWWYPLWLSGVSSSFSVSLSVVSNCCRKRLLKWWTFAFVDIWEGMGARHGYCGRGGRVRCLGRPGKGRVKGGKEERKGGECKVKWMNRATGKTTK